MIGAKRIKALLIVKNPSKCKAKKFYREMMMWMLHADKGMEHHYLFVICHISLPNTQKTQLFAADNHMLIYVITVARVAPILDENKETMKKEIMFIMNIYT